MRSKILYLITGIFLLVILTQCQDSLTSTNPPSDSEEELPVPQLISPTNNATNQSLQVDLNWKRIKGAKDYKIQLSKSDDFESTLLDSMIEGSSFTTPPLELSTTYFWRVKPFKKNHEGPWSETWQFTTSSGDIEPVTVELQSPADDTVLNTEIPKFEWSAVSESADYHFQLSQDENFNDLVKDSVVDVSDVEVVLSGADGIYHWRVSPIVDSAPTEWSEVFDFTKEVTASDSIDLSAPVQISPDDGATEVALQPTFEWERVDGAEYYILHANSVDPSEMVIETEVKGNTFTPDADLATQTSHDWRVRAVAGNTQGDWSEIHRFTTGSGESGGSGSSTVSLNSPSDGSSYQPVNLTLDWETVSGASDYQVQLAASSSFSSPVVDESVTESAYDASGLDYNQTYYWRVQTNGDGDSSNWSAVYSFTTESDSNTGDYQNSVEGDRQALMDLYEATGGSSWSNNSGWGSGNPDNSWYGVEVNGNGRVVRLDLSGNNLSGSLPESIGNLSKVTYFNVKQNSLSGQIPSSIGGMVSLTHLLLNGRKMDMNTEDPHHPGKPVGGSWADERSNNFTGQIPKSIGNLTNLQWLELNGTGREGEGLEGPIPSSIENLINLKGIHLAYNRLTSLPNDLSRLSQLIHFTVGDNSMSGETIPDWLGSLTTLKFIWMDNMGLTGKVPNLSQLKDLEILIFTENDLTGSFPNYMIDGSMPKINLLSFSWNRNLTGELQKFGETNLAALQLNGTSMSGRIPQSITTQTNMVNLNLGWNNFEGEFPSDLTSMSRLRHIYANNNNFTGTVPKVDTSNEDLQFLHFQNNNMSGQVPVSLAEIGNLPKVGNNDLNLGNNQFSDSDLNPLIDALEADGNLEVLNY